MAEVMKATAAGGLIQPQGRAATGNMEAIEYHHLILSNGAWKTRAARFGAAINLQGLARCGCYLMK
jgi:hypothetical protein